MTEEVYYSSFVQWERETFPKLVEERKRNKLVNKLREIRDRPNEDSKVIGYSFHCPGCNVEHKVFIYPYKAIDGTSWDFVGTLSRPSITPGIVNQRQSADGSTSICHVHLLAGKLWFLTSCTHKLAGEIVDMVPIKRN